MMSTRRQQQAIKRQKVYLPIAWHPTVSGRVTHLVTSEVLFILAINYILKKIQREGSDRDPDIRVLFHYILAYADDGLSIARSAEDLQALIHFINILARKIELKFNSSK